MMSRILRSICLNSPPPQKNNVSSIEISSWSEYLVSMNYDLRKCAAALISIGLLFAPELFNLNSIATQTREQTCSEGWYITGYYVPREDELPDTTEQINVERVGDLNFSQKFLNEIRTEGWGITRFGWALGYYSNAWHRSDTGALDAAGNLLTDGAIAIDRSVIPRGAHVQIATLPSPWSSKTFRATDIGNGIVGQHIDVFTGIGLAAEQETFRITSNNNRVCF
jgi:3D (Asp-Asp-Asp) domain-containing protein